MPELDLVGLYHIPAGGYLRRGRVGRGYVEERHREGDDLQGDTRDDLPQLGGYQA